MIMLVGCRRHGETHITCQCQLSELHLLLMVVFVVVVVVVVFIGMTKPAIRLFP